MTASEFAFLSLGLVLGLVSGAALVEIFRSRPIAPREVRVTVAPDSVARRRAVTLAEDARPGAVIGVAAGGPADHGEAGPGWPGTLAESNDRSPLPPVGAGDPDSSARAAAPTIRRATLRAGAHPKATGRPVMAVDVPAGMDEMLASLRRASARATRGDKAGGPATARVRGERATATSTEARLTGAAERPGAAGTRRRASAGTAGVRTPERGAEGTA